MDNTVLAVQIMDLLDKLDPEGQCSLTVIINQTIAEQWAIPIINKLVKEQS